MPSSTAVRRRVQRSGPKLSPRRGQMLRRMGDLNRAAAFRDYHRVPMGDPKAWAMLLADTLIYHRDGCDLLTFRQCCKFPCDDEVALAAIHEVCRVASWRGGDYRPIRGRRAGQMIDLTAEERWACDIRTMDATDETDAERLARLKERKRGRRPSKETERDRGRQRRAKRGSQTRSEYLADAAAKAEEWKAEGISRRTWERRRAASSSVSQVRPASQSYLPRGRAPDALASPVQASRNARPCSPKLSRPRTWTKQPPRIDFCRETRWRWRDRWMIFRPLTGSYAIWTADL
jgi:hypothetical protein